MWTDPDPRTYPLSSYSYLILPITVQGNFTAEKGKTLAAFSYYAMCQGQQSSASLGYSPMPINLVQASFAQIAKIPGAQVQNINIQSCNNPTFTPSGAEPVGADRPVPPGLRQARADAVHDGHRRGTERLHAGERRGEGDDHDQGAERSGADAHRDGAAPSVGSSAATDAPGSAATTTTAPCDPTDSACINAVIVSGATSTSDPSQTSLFATPVTLSTAGGWSSTQTIMVLVLLVLLAAIFVPGLVARRLKRRDR